MLSQLVRCMGLAVLVGVLSCATPHPPTAEGSFNEDEMRGWSNSWTGWAYIDEIGDFPFRLRFLNPSSATLDLGAANLYDLELEDVEYAAQSLGFVWVTGSGERRAFQGEIVGNSADGTIAWGNKQGTFTLRQADRSIAPLDGAEQGLEPGFVLFSESDDLQTHDVWEISRAGYGEWIFRSLREGQQRVLLPMGERKFFAGHKLYNPSRSDCVVEALPSGLGVKATSCEGASGSATPFEVLHTDSEIPTPVGPLRTRTTQRSIEPLPIGVIIAPGSGWETAEDETFRAENLAALGLTVVTFDKRGYGASAGEQVRSFADTAQDFATVIDWARATHPEVGRWGIWTLSRGGWIAPLVPEFNKRFDFAVLSVCPAVTPLEQELDARMERLRRRSESADVLAQAREYYDHLAALAVDLAGGPRARYQTLHQQLADLLGEGLHGPELDNLEHWNWWALNGSYEPRKALAAIQIPTLAIFGADDVPVPIEPNRRLMQEFDLFDGKANFEFKTVPGAGHNLELPQEGPMIDFDTLGSEGISEVWSWALSTR